ncbi:MAG: hypothetical protein HKN09_11880 [Saprospiraceae bacterium]|nr:hypothetical protein [Saprospiraceae bacterium]
MNNAALYESTVILLQEFWGYSQGDAKELIQKAKEELQAAIAKLDTNTHGGFLKNIKSHINSELIPASFNVAALNHGQINALAIAGRSIWRHLIQNSGSTQRKSLSGKQIDLLFAILSSEIITGKRPMAITKEKPAIPPNAMLKANEVEGDSQAETFPTLKFSHIIKWVLIGFLILFALCFLLLHLFS